MLLNVLLDNIGSLLVVNLGITYDPLSKVDVAADLNSRASICVLTILTFSMTPIHNGIPGKNYCYSINICSIYFFSEPYSH